MEKKEKNDGGKNMNAVVERYCTVSESLEESLKQMKLIREGNLPKRTWKELKKEIENDNSDNGK